MAPASSECDSVFAMPKTALPATSLVFALFVGCAHEGPANTNATANSATPSSPESNPSSTGAQGASQTSNESAAQTAALAWLALVDAGSYDQSWSEAATLFRRVVDQGVWQKQVGGVRAPLGSVLSRSLKSARYATSLPGAPDGQYVVVQFNTSFTNKSSAIETVTPMKEPDGTWRVSGYFIK